MTQPPHANDTAPPLNEIGARAGAVFVTVFNLLAGLVFLALLLVMTVNAFWAVFTGGHMPWLVPVRPFLEAILGAGAASYLFDLWCRVQRPYETPSQQVERIVRDAQRRGKMR